MPALISRSPRKVLLIRAGALGDLLLLRRAIASLRAAGASVSLLAPAAREVLRAEVQGLYDWEDRAIASLASGEVPKGQLADRLCTYDAAIAYTANEALVAALRRIIPVVQAQSPIALEPNTHASVTLARPALALGGRPDVNPPVLVSRAEDRTVADDWAQRLGGGGAFLALHPGSGSARKNWPAERFAELAERLAAGRKVLVVEGPADEAAAAPLRRLEGAVVARCLPLGTLGALLARAFLYVGNDSGVSHLAAAGGAPTLALFGPTEAAVWSPVGALVRVIEAPEGELDRLDAATVAAAAHDALRSWSAPPALPSG